MEFSTEHIERHEQLTSLKEPSTDLYAHLQNKYNILHCEMIEYKTKARSINSNCSSKYKEKQGSTTR